MSPLGLKPSPSMSTKIGFATAVGISLAWSGPPPGPVPSLRRRDHDQVGVGRQLQRQVLGEHHGRLVELVGVRAAREVPSDRPRR